jgi:hypothetical protein
MNMARFCMNRKRTSSRTSILKITGGCLNMMKNTGMDKIKEINPIIFFLRYDLAVAADHESFTSFNITNESIILIE